MCTLAARLVKLRLVTVTFFTVPAFYDRAQAEIAREFEQGEDSVASRIRLANGRLTPGYMSDADGNVFQADCS